MQLKFFHSSVYKHEARMRRLQSREELRKPYQERVDKWRALKAVGVSDRLCQQTVCISRATFFRHQKILDWIDQGLSPPSRRRKNPNKPRWGTAEVQAVLKIRKESPTYGKAKIAFILRRDAHLSLSESTVGRILSHLMETGVLKNPLLAARKKRKRDFSKGHAQRWTFKDHQSIALGERVQIDHMVVTTNQTTVRHFQAWDRRSKFVHANVFSNATSHSARVFLEDLLQKSPFPIQSIQVDGGSEFMAEFEEGCREHGIPLMVLPPKRPTYNGGVERANRTFREEFYRYNFSADTVSSIRADLQVALHKYNSYRPHAHLLGLTPLEYIRLNTPGGLS